MSSIKIRSMANDVGYSFSSYNSEPVNRPSSANYDSFTAQGLNGFDAIKTNTTAFAGGGFQLSHGVSIGDVITATFDFVLNSGTAPTVKLQTGFVGSALSFQTLTPVTGINTVAFTVSTANSTPVLDFETNPVTNVCDIEVRNMVIRSSVESDMVIIPRNEAIPAEDVLGNALQYTGRVKYNDDVVASPCGNFDGVVDKITFSDLTGVSITSYQGTATPTIVGNEILCTAGTLYNLVLSNGWHFPFTEKSGLTIHNKADENNPGTLVTGDEVAFWRETQDVYHDFLLNGGSRGVNAIPSSEDITFATSGGNGGYVAQLGVSIDDFESVTYPATTGAGSSNARLFVGTYNNLAAEGEHTFSVKIKGEVGGELVRIFFERDIGGSYEGVSSGILTLTNDWVKHDLTFDFVNGPHTRLRVLVVGAGNTSTQTVNFKEFQIKKESAFSEYQKTLKFDSFGQYIPALSDGSGNDCLGNEIQYPAGNHRNYPPSLLKAPEAPALTCPFVHGGTFDGATQWVVTNSPFSATSSYRVEGYFKIPTAEVGWSVLFDGRDLGNDGFAILLNSSERLRVIHNATVTDGTVSVNTDTVYKLVSVWDGSTNTTTITELDGTVVDTIVVSDSSALSCTTNFVIGAKSFSILGDTPIEARISGVKVIADGVTIIDEPLNGTLNNATLTGDSDTFWVEEHHNQKFDSSGNAIPYNPADLGANYLGLNREFADVSDPTKIKNIVVLDEPATGTDLQTILKFTNQL